MAQLLTVTKIRSLIKSGKPGRHSAGNNLYFRISDEATATWVVRYTIYGKRREMTLGNYPSISLADAYARALQIKEDCKNDIDPLAQRRRADIGDFNTVEDLAEDWLADCSKRLKHPKIPIRIYKKDIHPLIGELAIDQVTPRDIRAIINAITKNGRPTIANDALMYCKQLFRHGIKLDLLTHNPAEPFTATDAGGIEKSRSRALSLDDLKITFKVFRENHNQFTRENYLAIALLVSLGIRKGELVAAKWEEFDTQKQLWNIPKERSKTEVPITIPLPNEAMKWLEELHIRAGQSDYVFPNRRSSIRYQHISPDTINAAVQKLHRENKLKIEHFTIHDLRRTFRSLLSSEGIPGHIAERCLNHKLKGVEGIYDRYDYLDERKHALEVISKKIAPLINAGTEQKFSFTNH
ncbi:MAG: tyrosine-type recombinase/integrase [Gammaproteobacteria bacterium]|nr:tyrosine-type recombinase/integrase [Gammaproteobacteria bacterium]